MSDNVDQEAKEKLGENKTIHFRSNVGTHLMRSNPNHVSHQKSLHCQQRKMAAAIFFFSSMIALLLW